MGKCKYDQVPLNETLFKRIFMQQRLNQTSSKVWQDRCGLLLDGLTAPGAGGLPGAGGNAAAVAIELASEKKVFSLPAKCRSRRRKLNKSLTNTEGFQRLARCIFKAIFIPQQNSKSY